MMWNLMQIIAFIRSYDSVVFVALECYFVPWEIQFHFVAVDEQPLVSRSITWIIEPQTNNYVNCIGNKPKIISWMRLCIFIAIDIEWINSFGINQIIDWIDGKPYWNWLFASMKMLFSIKFQRKKMPRKSQIIRSLSGRYSVEHASAFSANHKSNLVTMKSVDDSWRMVLLDQFDITEHLTWKLHFMSRVTHH